jgi:hypothetical protein
MTIGLRRAALNGLRGMLQLGVAVAVASSGTGAWTKTRPSTKLLPLKVVGTHVENGKREGCACAA